MGTTTLPGSLLVGAENPVAEYSIPHKQRHVFSSYQALRKFLEDSYNQWQNKSASQFIGIEGIDEQRLRWFDTHNRELPSMRVLYDQDVEKLVIKLVSRAHDLAAREFFNAFFDASNRIGINRRDVKDAATGRVSGTGSRQKEPDGQLFPRTRSAGDQDRPTFVLEIGYSESLGQLRNDAHFWLTQTSGFTGIALLLHIKQAQRILEFERWENQPNPRQVRPNTSVHASRPTNMQTVQISMQPNGPPVVIGAPILLDVDLLFDSPPAHISVTTPLSITAQDLASFAEEFFTFVS